MVPHLITNIENSAKRLASFDIRLTICPAEEDCRAAFESLRARVDRRAAIGIATERTATTQLKNSLPPSRVDRRAAIGIATGARASTRVCLFNAHRNDFWYSSVMTTARCLTCSSSSSSTGKRTMSVPRTFCHSLAEWPRKAEWPCSGTAAAKAVPGPFCHSLAEWPRKVKERRC